MTNSARAAKPLPVVPSRQGSSGATEEPGSRGWTVLSFPPSNKLIVTTTKGVYIWDAHGTTEIFRSGSEGIVAAKRIISGSEMLAVADSQVVVLHDIGGGLQRSYRLKGSDVGVFLQENYNSADSTKGQVRLLKYAKESESLFFTTTLQNSVQSYSLKHSKLLDPAHTHPSPPSVFALSCTSRFLLSTSSAPPTIHLTSLALNTRPVLLHPTSSSSAVVAAEFHPEQENYFCLAFADGTAAFYDANHFYDSHGNGERRDNAVMVGTGGEMAFIRRLHIGTMTKNAATGGGVTFEGFDPDIDQGGTGLTESGISAIAFVPGRKATVVTVGADGKCCVVDFTQPTKHKAVLLNSWHIRRPATSLSIICSAKKGAIRYSRGASEPEPEPEPRHSLPTESYYIAVGGSDGRLLLFDLDGKALGQHVLDNRGARIIDVEWTQIGGRAPLPYQSNSSGIRRSPVVKRNRKSLRSSAFVESRPLRLELLAMPSNVAQQSVDPLFDFTKSHQTLGVFDGEPPTDESTLTAAIPWEGSGEGDAIVEASSSNKDSQQRPTHVMIESSSATVKRKAMRSPSQTSTEASSSFRSSTEDDSTPPVPPRPDPKPGGRLSIRRAQTTRQSDIQSTSYLSMMAKPRKTSASNPRISRTISVANPPTKTKVFFGPRRPPSPEINNSRDITEASKVQIMSEQPEDGWLDVPETPRRATEVSPVSSATSNRSYKTAVSHHYTSNSLERSDDTVVDWTAGLPPQPVPTLQITQPSGERSSTVKSKRKRHISLSVSSGSARTPTPAPSVSNAGASLISGPSAGSPPKLLPSLPSTRSTEPGMVGKTGPKQKCHTSLPVSSASSSDAIAPISSDSDSPIIRWPSLKKSPRIPELNKGLPDPNKYVRPPTSSPEEPVSDSVTNTVLQGYTFSPSSSPTRPANTSWLVSTTYPKLPRSPLRAPPKPVLVSTVDLKRESQPCSCTCSLTMESILEASFSTLLTEITQKFEVQKTWFEELLKANEKCGMMLAEEQRWLRGESARVEIEKEKGKGQTHDENTS